MLDTHVMSYPVGWGQHFYASRPKLPTGLLQLQHIPLKPMSLLQLQPQGSDSLSGPLITRSREVSKPRDTVSDFLIALKFDRHLGHSASKRYNHYNIHSRGIESSRHLLVSKTSYHLVSRGPGPNAHESTATESGKRHLKFFSLY